MSYNYNLQTKCKCKAREKVEFEYLQEILSERSGWTVTPTSNFNSISDNDYARHDAVVSNGETEYLIEMKSRDVDCDVFGDCYIDRSKLDSMIDNGGGYVVVYYYLSNDVYVWKVDAFARTSWRKVDKEVRKNNYTDEKITKPLYALPFAYATEVIKKDMSDFPNRFIESWTEYAVAYDVYDENVEKEINKYLRKIEIPRSHYENNR